jgi:hypothetical protein
MKITAQMRRMVRDVEYAKIVAQMVDAQDAMREYEQRYKRVPLAELARRPPSKLVKVTEY